MQEGQNRQAGRCGWGCAVGELSAKEKEKAWWWCAEEKAGAGAVVVNHACRCRQVIGIKRVCLHRCLSERHGGGVWCGRECRYVWES